MKYIKFSIFDSKAGGFLPDWNAINVPVAIRLFQEGILTENSVYGKHPGDYTLMEIGTFDQESGEVTNLSPKIDHGTALFHKSQAILQIAAQEQRAAREERIEGLNKAARKKEWDSRETTP